jgi:hypothetical protein
MRRIGDTPRNNTREQIGAGFPKRKEHEMTNTKLQVAIDELERLRDTVKGFNERNGTPPNPDSDAGRAFLSLKSFAVEYRKLDIDKLLRG